MHATGFWQLLPEADRTAMSALGRARNFAPGSSMCGEGEPATHVFALLAGWVKVQSVTSDSHDRFSSFLASHPEADRAYHRLLAQRWSDSDSELRRRSATSGAQRLAGVLLSLAKHFGAATAGGTELAVPLSQEELASLAGTSRATVTRAFATWRRRGIIGGTGQRPLVIRDERSLRQAAGPMLT